MNSSQTVRGYVVLKPGSDSGPATADVPASAGIQQLASKRLSEHGLLVKRSSPLSITVEGQPQAFERAFQGKLEARNGAISWDRKLTIPDKLKDLVADVVFPQPVKYTT